MKINRKFIKGTNWALAGLLGLLGFSNCVIVDTRVEYGSPSVDYKVKGLVANKADGKPIEGIQVSLRYPKPDDTFPVLNSDSVITNAKGEFEIIGNYYNCMESSYKIMPVYVDDIDGEKNGLFQSDTLQVNFQNAEQTKKSNGWYDGEFTVTVNIELTEIKNQ